MTEPEKTNEKKSARGRPEENREITFHYSRDHRMESASNAVRDLNEDPFSRPRFFKTVFGNRGNLVLIVSIAAICFIYFINNLNSGQSDPEFKYGNNTINISIYYEENVLFLYVRKDVLRGAYAYTGAVDVAVSPVPSGGEEAPIQTHRIFFTLDSPETYLVSLPFDGDKFIVVFHSDNETTVRTITRSNKSPIR